MFYVLYKFCAIFVLVYVIAATSSNTIRLATEVQETEPTEVVRSDENFWIKDQA